MRRRSVAAMGTSITGLEDIRPWTQMLADTLGVGRSDVYSVYNFGVSSSQTSDRLANMAPILFVRPDIAILEFTVNDAYTPYGVSTAQCRTRTEAIVAALRDQNADVQIVLLITNPCVPGSAPAAARPNQASYADVYRTMASQDESLSLVDTWSAWGTPTLEDIPDGIHPPMSKYREIIIPSIAASIGGAVT